MNDEEPDWICLVCLADEQLRRLAEDPSPAAPHDEGGVILRERQDFGPKACSFCDQVDLGMPADELVDRVEHVLRTQYAFQSENVMGSIERHLQKEGLWQRPGEPLNDVLYDLGVTNDVVRDRVLDRLADRDDPESIGEMEFDADAHWAPVSDDGGAGREWERIERELLSGPRFFNEQARAFFSRVLEAYEAVHRDEPRRPAGTHLQKGQYVYRARVFEPYETDEIGKAIADPAKHVGPPPARVAAAGRMNAQHVPVFYAADSLKTAVAEVRPPVGSRVVVAKFVLQRGVSLFDLTQGKLDKFVPNPFDVALQRQAPMARFLRDLRRIIARPITPGRQSQDYVVTQAFCDYLATCASDLGDRQVGSVYDGLVFDSAQSGIAGARNVVLFPRAASQIADLGVRDHRSRVGEWDEDIYHEAYTVDVEAGGNQDGRHTAPVLACDPADVTVHEVGPYVPPLTAVPVRRQAMSPEEFTRRHRTEPPF